MSETYNLLTDDSVAFEVHRRYADRTVPTQTIVDTCQAISRQAWSAQLPERNPAEIGELFGSAASQEGFRKVFWSLGSANALRESRSWGRLDKLMTYGAGSLVIAKLMEDPSELLTPARGLGYVIARNNVSGTLSERMAKSRAGRQPYAWIQSISVRPEHQGRGLGSALLGRALQEFRPDQKPTAYVLDENPRGLEYFANLGFVKQPPEQEPATHRGYFGPGSTPIHMWRLEAESVATVQARLASRGALPEAVRS